MKKTNIVFCMLLLALLGGSVLRAQGSNLRVTLAVETVDRASLRSARIYANPNPGQDYYVDAAHLAPGYSGTALPVSSLIGNEELTLTVDGFHVEAYVDSLIYAESFILVEDTNSVFYIYGQSTSLDRQTGIFTSRALFANGSIDDTLTVLANMLRPMPYVVEDLTGYAYTSLDRAVKACPSGTSLRFIADVPVDTTVTFRRNLTVNQNGHTLVSSISNAETPAIRIVGANVTWNGGTASDATAPASAGSFFSIRNGSLNLNRFSANAATNVVYVGSGAALNFNGGTIGSQAPAGAAIVMADNGNVNIDTAFFTTCNYGILLASTSIGKLHILSHTVDNNMTACNIPVAADARVSKNGYYYYRLTLDDVLRRDAISGDTVTLCRSTAATLLDTVAMPLVLDLDGHEMQGDLCLAHTTGTVELRNGRIATVGTLAGTSGDVHAVDLDSVVTFDAGTHPLTIDGGRYLSVTPATGASIVINAGKFAQSALEGYVPEGHHMISNHDADAAVFPYLVKQGFRVVFNNFDARGHDSVAVVATPDNRIVPAPGRPSYVGSDTVFVTYWTDQTFTTPWQFLIDTLSSDTTLYAQWITDFNPATQYHYTVVYQRWNYEQGALAPVYSYAGVADQGVSVKVPVRSYEGCSFESCSSTASGSPSLVGDTLVFSQIGMENESIVISYALNTYTVTWDFNGGTVTGTPQTQFHYTEPIAYPTVTLPGHSLAWVPNPATMPARNLTIAARYTHKDYPLTWTGLDTTLLYTANPVNTVRAYYTNDDNLQVDAVLSYTDTNNTVSASAVNCGRYTVAATSADTNYALAGITSTTLTIIPDTVTVIGVVIAKEKLEDGTDTALVENPGAPDHVLGSDDLAVSTAATFSQATVGTGLTITARYTLTGASAGNYTLRTASEVYATDGEIVAPIVIDINAATADSGIVVSPDNYCGGETGKAAFILETGSNTPDQYRLFFSSEAHTAGFVDVDTPMPLTTATDFNIVIPAMAPMGNYTAYIRLSNSAYNVGTTPRFESDSIPVHITVNVPKFYTMPIFSDVISIVDTCHCIDQSTVVWYHNGVRVGTGAYYQEPSGSLTGTYHVEMVVNGVPAKSCEQDDMNTIVTDAAVAMVTVYPNPTVDRVRVKVENSFYPTHVLRVMNVMGVTMLNTVFDGNETSIDFSGFANGAYTVSVDGVVNRVIKK